MTEYDRLAGEFVEAGKRLVEESRRCLAGVIHERYPTATAAVAWLDDGIAFLHGLEGCKFDVETEAWEELMDETTVYLDDVWMIEHHADPSIDEFTVQLPRNAV